MYGLNGWNSTCKATISVTGTPTPTLATLSATPCTIPNTSTTGTCTSTVSWTAASGQNVQVWSYDTTGAGKLFACSGGSGSQSASWISSVKTRFSIYRTPTCNASDIAGLTADMSVDVTGQVQPAKLSASPNPCTLSSSGTCSSTLSWQAAAGQSYQLRLTGSTNPIACSGGSGSIVIPWIVANGYTFQIYRAAGCSSSISGLTADDTITVKGVTGTTASNPYANIANVISSIQAVLESMRAGQ